MRHIRFIAARRADERGVKPFGRLRRRPASAASLCARTYPKLSPGEGLFAAVHESAFGTKRTSQRAQLMSAIGGKADIAQAVVNVCF